MADVLGKKCNFPGCAFKHGEELVQVERKIITFLLSIHYIVYPEKVSNFRLFSCGMSANSFRMTKGILFFPFYFIRYNLVLFDDS